MTTPDPVTVTELLRDVAASGVAFEDPRLGYIEVQIDRDTWDAIQQLVRPVADERNGT